MRSFSSTLLGLAVAGLAAIGSAGAAPVGSAQPSGAHWIFTAPNPEGNQAQNQPANALKLGSRRTGVSSAYRGYRARHHRRHYRRRHHR